MKGIMEGYEFTPGGARLAISYLDPRGQKRGLYITLPTDRVLRKVDIQRAISGEVAKLALIQKRIRVIKDLMGTEVELSDDLL